MKSFPFELIRKKNFWSAIFVAVLIGFGINFILNLFTFSLGISIFSSIHEGKPIFSFTGFLVFCFISIISMFLTGFFAGLLAPDANANTFWGCLIGFVAWTILLILTVVIITNMLQYTAFHSNFTSHPQLGAIRIENSNPMVIEKQNGIILQPPVNLTYGQAKNVVSVNSFITFGLFLLGAFSSMTGGYLGFYLQKRLTKKPVRNL